AGPVADRVDLVVQGFQGTPAHDQAGEHEDAMKLTLRTTWSSPGRSSRRRGFTMAELLVGTSILFVLAGALTMSVSSMKKLTVHGTVDSQLQNMGERALAQITTD